MPEPPSPEVKEFLTALDGFMDNPPRDLPDGSLESIKELGQVLRGYHGGAADAPSAGEREAQQAAAQAQAGHSDVAVPYKQAATGADKPSPGQREYQAAIDKAAQTILSSGAPSSSE